MMERARSQPFRLVHGWDLRFRSASFPRCKEDTA